MTATSNGWAAWALRALTAGRKSERRPMPRVRLGCELMEGRFVPATVLYTGTETWTGGGGDVTVTSTATEDAPGYSGKILWQYHVTNDSFQPAYPRDDGVSVFGVPVDDPTGVADITNSMGWIGVASDANYVTGGGPGVIWVGSGDPEDTGGYLRPGASADFSFTTPDTAPTSTDATGSAFNDGVAASADGFCAAPVVGVPSISFPLVIVLGVTITDGRPQAGTNAGDIKFDLRWDNLPAGATKVKVERDLGGGMWGFLGFVPNVGAGSNSKSANNFSTGLANTNVTLRLTVLDNIGLPMNNVPQLFGSGTTK